MFSGAKLACPIACHFVGVRKTDLRPRAALVRDGEHPLNLRAMGWHLERRTPRYTTHWDEMPIVRT